MNVLMLTHRLPYAPNRGDRRRAYHLLRFLSARYSVHLVSLVDDEDEVSRVPGMAGMAASISVARRSPLALAVRAAAAFTGTTPLTHALLDSPALSSTIRHVVDKAKPDVVLAYCSGMARFALEPPLAGVPFVLDLVDVDSDKWRTYADRSNPPLSWIYRRESRCLGAFEARAARAAKATLVVNARELEPLKALAPDANALVVQNGIDLDELRSPRPPATQERVLFCGVMNYRPNDEGARWFLTAVWPRIHAARPAATLCIAGTAPTAGLKRVAEAAGGVEVTGHVEDVRPYYWDAAVFVAPIHLARGVQNKVLDAAAGGVPSVVTSAVAAGLPPEIVPSCLVADDADGFASAVLDLLGRSPEARRAIASRADLRELGWPQRLEPLANLIEGIRS